MISITSAPEAPAPRIRILDSRAKEVKCWNTMMAFLVNRAEPTSWNVKKLLWYFWWTLFTEHPNNAWMPNVSLHIIHNCHNCQQKVETVRIGDRLTFRIEIPEKTPYGIFARCEDNERGKELILQYWKKYLLLNLFRNCVAMAKDSRSTFPIIDENGCPVDPTIFPRHWKI